MRAIIENISNMSGSDVPRYASINFGAIETVINGNVEFGPNIRSSVVEVIFPGAGQVIAVPHTLGRVPAGYLVAKQDAAGSVLTSELTNNWTASVIYLNASAAMTTTLIIV